MKEKKIKRRVGRPTKLETNSPEAKIAKTVSMERRIWEDLDTYCQDSGTNRSQLIENLVVDYLT